jgi:hypothetical protein
MPSTPLKQSPTVGVIDENNVLTLSWQALDPITYYDHWDAKIDGNSNSRAVDLASIAQTFTTILGVGDHDLTMKPFVSAAGTSAGFATPADYWTTSAAPATRNFPAVVGPSSVSLDNTTLLLGQPLNATLNPLYTGADQWQVLWPDNTGTGWLPLSASVVTKQFSTPGSFAVVVQTRRSYTGSQYDPPATLIRQLSISIFVMDQQAATTNQAGTGLSTTLGFAGTEGFEIIDTSAAVVTPEPWEVIARGVIRDTVTNELQLIVATTRFPNASSLLGTMALDVFPIEGRPHVKELLTPVFQIITNDSTTAIPVKIQTSQLPDIIVGKSINDALGGTLQMTVKDTTGVPDFIWNATGLPDGVFMGANGIIAGVPLELGIFNVTFSVQDSGSPFSIDEITLPITVKTDLLVQIAPGQKDANSTALVVTGTTLGVAQVGKPYSVQMAVGNILTTSSLPGGLPPYKWSVPAGAFPVGLSIDPDTGLLAGTPTTYNSSTDFSKTFSGVIQVTDAIGAKASTTYTMTLEPAVLALGEVDQAVIYATQDFKLTVPVFGGQAPYTLNSVAGSDTFISSGLVDGQIEVVLNIPSNKLGGHNFTISVTDSQFSPVTVLKQISYNVLAPTSATAMVKAFANHYWYNGDSGSATPIPIVGPGFSGLVLVADVEIPANGITITVDPTAPQTTFAGPPTAYENSEQRVPLKLYHAEQEVGRISRLYTLLTHDKTTPGTDIGNIHTVARPLIIGDVVGFNPRKPYYNSPATIPATIVGATLTARVQAGSTLPLGFSLDTQTGLIYGKLVALPPSTSVIEYTDSTGAVHGTVTINWSPAASNDFATTTTQAVGQLGTTYNPTTSPLVTIAPPSGVTLASATLVGGSLSGLAPSIAIPTGFSTPVAVLSGTPSDAGYFDAWVSLTTTNGHSTVVYLRIAVVDPLPFLILTSTLPDIGAAAYSATLYGFGGVPSSSGQYLWSINGFTGGVTGTGNFAGLTLDPNTGIISGALSSPPGGSGLTDLGTLTVVCTDYRVVNTALATNVSLPATTQQVLDLTYTGSLIVVTTNSSSPHNDLPTAVSFAVTSADAMSGSNTVYHGTFSGSGYANKFFTVTGFSNGAINGTFLYVSNTSSTLTLANGNAHSSEGPITGAAGLEYGFTLQAAGGTGIYSSWAVTGGSLPSGITLVAGTGVLKGAWDFTSYGGSPVTFQVTDSGANTATAIFTFRTGLETITIDGSNVGTVNIGAPYLGSLLSDIVNGTAASWQVAPTTAGGQHPNSLDTGLVLLTDNNQSANEFSNPDNGETGSVAGTYSGAAFASHLVRVVVVDANGNTGSAILVFSTGTNMAITDSSPLPNATIGIPYSYQMHEIGGVGPYTWTWDQSHPFHGLDISSSGLISGTPAATFTQNVLFTVTDSLSNVATATLSLTSQPSGLAITTPPPLTAVSGRDANILLSAAGSANKPYVFSISPFSAYQLPTGLTLSTDAGATATTAHITGTTTLSGFDKTITFRVTDSLGAQADQDLEFIVSQGLDMKTGVDYTDSLALNILGYIDNGAVTSINPRPNSAFLVVATGVVSNSPGAIQVSTGNPGIAAAVTSLDTNTGTAVITLSGAAFDLAPGTYQVSVTINDSGVQVTKTFSWVVYDDGVLRAAPGSGSFPQQLISGQ